MRKIKFFGIPFQTFLLLIIATCSYLIYDGMFNCRIPNTDKFCVIKKYELYKSYRYDNVKQYRFICTNRLGTFDIESGYNTYSDTNIGDSVQLEKYPDTHRLFDYSVNKKTDDNIINSIDNKLYKFFYKHIILFLCLMVFYIIVFFYELVNIMYYASIHINKLVNKIFDFNRNDD